MCRRRRIAEGAFDSCCLKESRRNAQASFLSFQRSRALALSLSIRCTVAMPLFGRRKSAPDTSAAIQLDSTIDYAPPSLPPKRAKTRKSAGLQPVDEHGRATRYGSVPPLRRSYSDGSSRRPVSIGGDELQVCSAFYTSYDGL